MSVIFDPADAQRFHERLLTSEATLTRLEATRGWTSEAIERLDIGFDENGRIVFPYLNDGRALVGFGRYLPDAAERNGARKLLVDRGSRRQLFPPPEAVNEDVGGWLWLLEGEPDTIRAHSVGLAAIGVPGVAGWQPEYARRFLGARVCVCFDCDRVGREAAQRVAHDLAECAIDVRVLDLDPSVDDGFDLSDFLAKAKTASERQEARRILERCAEATPRVEPVAAASEQPFALEVLTARKVVELPEPNDGDEVLGSLLIRGQRLVLGGATGDGKTTATLQLIRAVVSGDDFLGWSGCGGRALVIDAEQGLRTIKRRLREAGLDESEAVDYVRAPDGLSLDSHEQHFAEVERIVAEGGYAVVAADPLYKLHSGDSNDERAAVDLMRRFDRLREQYRFALVLPVHLRKRPQGAKFTMDEFFGSSAYLRGAEVVVGLQRVRRGYSRLHFFKDRDGDLPIGEAWGLLFERESGFRRDPSDRAKTTAEQVRELLAANPELTIEQLQAATGKAERTIRDALKTIGASAKRVGQTGEKLWSLDDLLDEDEAA